MLVEIVLLTALALALAFVIHEGLCRSRGDILPVAPEHIAQARLMFWLMIGGVVLAGSSLLMEPSLLSGLLLGIAVLLAVGWSQRRQRMVPEAGEE